MEFTFWEHKSVKLPMGPLWGIFGFLGGVVVLAVLGTIAGNLVTKKEIISNAPTLPELEAWEKTVVTKDLTKIDELLKKEGNRIGADLAKWTLVAEWKNDVLMDLYQSDLLINLRSQIDSLKKMIEAEKAKAAGGDQKETPAATPAPAPAPAPTKQ
jgi:hypothetical protein